MVVTTAEVKRGSKTLPRFTVKIAFKTEENGLMFIKKKLESFVEHYFFIF